MIIYSIEELPDSSFGVCKWEVTPWVGHPGGYFFVVQIVDESRYGQVRIYGEHERSDFEKEYFSDYKAALEECHKVYGVTAEHAMSHVSKWFSQYGDIPIDFTSEVIKVIDMKFYTLISRESGYPLDRCYLKITRRGSDYLTELAKA